MLASEKYFKTISIPAISSSIFGFPKNMCAAILVNEVRRFFENGIVTTIETVEFCVVDDETMC
jgi:O-acetyl-ADP-ribose deacetylase (regulator of RNase III)